MMASAGQTRVDPTQAIAVQEIVQDLAFPDKVRSELISSFRSRSGCHMLPNRTNVVTLWMFTHFALVLSLHPALPLSFSTSANCSGVSERERF